MSPARPARERYALEAGIDGPRMTCVTEPADAVPCGVIVLLPPFAEEMNKTRRMCAEFARTAAAKGWRVVRQDPYGTGDSAGEFGEATWARWTNDLLGLVRDEAAQATGALCLWAVRAGALMVGDLVASHPSAHVLLWQPVLAGSQHLQQFLRLHSAARLLGGAADSQALPGPAARLAAGQAVEVAGYEIHPALAQGLKEASFRLPPASTGRLAWFEVGDAAAPPGLAVRRAQESLVAAGHEVRLSTVAGDMFWQTTEVTEVPALLEASADCLDRFAYAAAPSTTPQTSPAA